MRKILLFSLSVVVLSLIPETFAWDGLMALDGDKRKVELGERINYQGYLYRETLIDDKLVHITVFEKELGKAILEFNLTPESDTGEYFENTAGPFSFEVDTSKEFDYGRVRGCCKLW